MKTDGLFFFCLLKIQGREICNPTTKKAVALNSAFAGLIQTSGIDQPAAALA